MNLLWVVAPAAIVLIIAYVTYGRLLSRLLRLDPKAKTPAVELRDDGLRIRDDHVIVEMLRGLGAQIVRRRAPFNPESGAYHEHGQRHGHDDDHRH